MGIVREAPHDLHLATRLATALAQLLRGPQRGQIEGQRLVAAARDDAHLGRDRRTVVARDQLLHPEGFASEIEVVRAMGDAGLQPMEIITAATSVPAAILGLNDLGTIAVGKKADFLAMPTNPLEKISDIKDVGSLYLGGNEQERTALVQDIKINTQNLRITEKDRKADRQRRKG